MLLLLSSNASRRYSDDIVRALAHPRGTDFQFRYGLEFFDPSLLLRAKTNRLAGLKAVVVFLNTNASARSVSMVLCRAVTIRRSELIGTSCILTLTAGDYLEHLDDAAIRARLNSQERALLPVWGTNTDYPIGKFVIDVTAAIDSSQAAARNNEMEAFEATAMALSSYSCFDADTKIAFYAVREVLTEDDWRPGPWHRGRRRATYANGRYELQSGYRYDLETYIYSPSGGKTDKGVTKLSVDSDEKAVRFTSAKELPLDSRYDLNRFSFTTDEQINAISAALRVSLSVPHALDSDKRELRCDIVVETRFAGWWPRICARIILIAIGTASPAIIGVAYKDEMSFGIAVIMFGGALIAGWAAVLPSLRKS